MLCAFLLCNAQISDNVKWDYPIKPGMEGWKERPYHENVEKSQPPKELMNSWNTETLFAYCLDYPFNLVTWMFDNPYVGFKFVYDQATVWQEFIRRKDAPDVLTHYFDNLSFERLFEIKEDHFVGHEKLMLYFLEKLISETDFTANLDSSSKRKLVNAVLKTHQNKKKYPDQFLAYSYNTSLYALAKILESDPSNDAISLAKLRETTGYGRSNDENMDATITASVLNYLNK